MSGGFIPMNGALLKPNGGLKSRGLAIKRFLYRRLLNLIAEMLMSLLKGYIFKMLESDCYIVNGTGKY